MGGGALGRLREQVQLAELVGLDLVVLPDHVLYAAGGPGDYAQPDEAVGAWESVGLAAALCAATSSIGVGHSMMNAPYRPPMLVAEPAATLDEVSAGRYQLGIGAGTASTTRLWESKPTTDLSGSPRWSRSCTGCSAPEGPTTWETGREHGPPRWCCRPRAASVRAWWSQHVARDRCGWPHGSATPGSRGSAPTPSEGTHSSRMRALEAMASTVEDVHAR